MNFDHSVLKWAFAALALLAHQVQASPFLYIPDTFWNTVGVIDTSSWRLVANIPVGSGPSAVAVNPVAGNIYVGTIPRTVTVIDGKTNAVIKNISVDRSPLGIALSPDGTRAYVSSYLEHTITTIDTVTNTVIGSFEAGESLDGVVVSPDGARLYAASSGDNTLSIINTASRSVIASVPVGLRPIGVAVTPDGLRIYVTNANDNSVSVVSSNTNKVFATIAVGRGPGSVAVSSDGRKVFVSNSRDDSVSVIDTTTNTVSALVAVADGAGGLSISPDGTLLYVVNTHSSTLSVIDTRTNAVQNSVTVRLGTPAGILAASGAFVSTQNVVSPPVLLDTAEYVYQPLNYYFLTSRASEKATLNSSTGWSRTPNRFKVYSGPGIAGTMPLRRYFFALVAKQGTRGSHFYTALSAEMEALRSLNPTNSSAPKLPYDEGIDSYVYPPLVEGVGGSCAPNQTPVMRVFRGPSIFPDDPNHRFLTDTFLYNIYARNGWIGEGVKFCAPN